MRKFYCLLLILSFAFSGLKAQNEEFKPERRIYLWDVTLSMKGFGGTPDIWDDVVEALVKDINSIVDEETEIIILPFQVSIIDVWKIKATPEEKKSLIKKIRQYNNETVTNTNICTPMRSVIDKHLSDTRRNVLLLLTDGNHNVDGKYPNSNKPNITCLLELINEWCKIADPKDAYAFYIMLTENAENEELSNAIKNACRITATTGTDLNFVELIVHSSHSFNIKDDEHKDVIVPVTCKKNVEIPEGVKIRVKSLSNEYIEVDEVCTLVDREIRFKIKYKKPYDELKEQLSQEYNEKVALEVSLAEETKKDHPLVLLLSEKLYVSLINKPEKTLRIYGSKKD